MNVLFWMNVGFDSHATSEHLLAAVIAQLVKAKNNVHVIQMIKDEGPAILPNSLLDSGVTTVGIKNSDANKSNFVARYINAIGYYWKCRKEIKKYRDSDAVFLQSTNVAGIAVWLAKRYVKKAKITLNVQDIFPYNAFFSGNIKEGFAFKVLAGIQRYAYKHSDHIITISEDMKQTLVADGVPKEKIKVVYNWSYQDGLYNIEDFTQIEHMFDKEFFNVVYAGNIGVMQNVGILIEAAKAMKNDKRVWFHIIGNGVYKEKLVKQATEYGIENIKFWPMQPHELAPLIYSAADVNVIPLEKDVYRTALPSKTATCIACKRPLIFAIGVESRFLASISDVVDVISIDSDDVQGLVNAVKDIMNNKVRSCNTDELQFTSRFSASINSKQYADVITE